jgi:hypothetical protein
LRSAGLAEKIEEFWVAELSWFVNVSWVVNIEFGDCGVCLSEFLGFGLIGCGGLGLIASRCKIVEFMV